MKAKEVEVGKVYAVKVSGRIVPVKILGTSPYGGWSGKNMRTGRVVHIRTAGKLRGEWNKETVLREYKKKLEWYSV